jgi:MYXO-CTERM domain-containing protein
LVPAVIQFRLARTPTEGFMSSRCLWSVWVGVAVVAAAAGDAAAGPLKWSYTAESVAAAGGNWAHFGTDTQTTFDPVTSVETQTQFQMIADIGAFTAGDHDGSGSIPVVSIGPDRLQPYAMDDAWASNRPPAFRIDVTITDVESGASHQLLYPVAGVSNGYFETGSFVVGLITVHRTDEFDLGGNHYSVRPRLRPTESANRIELDVTISEANQTPEPGTMALAVVGLVGIAAVRFRRR